jgi:hypothetical protein
MPARKLKFEFLKIFTLGGQHIRQGFQNYFCSEEISYFAKIIFEIWGLVTVSDSNFG